MTYLLIASPLGVIIGYVMTANFLNNWGWRATFYVQAAMLFPSMVGMIITPSKYMDI